MKKIAVLLTCYNRVDTTLECLRQLFAQKVPNGYSFDVWLVDDASPDRTGEKVKESFPSVHVIQGTGSLFWTGGMRYAWKKARASYDYDYYLWLNDDVELGKDALMRLLHASERQGSLSILCGSLVDPGSGNIVYGAPGVVFSSSTDNPVVIKQGMHGNVVLIPKNVFDRIGGMADRLVHQHGDSEYGYRARKHGIKVYALKPVGTCVANYGFDKRKLFKMNIVQRFMALMSPKQIGLPDYCRYKFLTVGILGSMLSCAKWVCIAMFPRLTLPFELRK